MEFEEPQKKTKNYEIGQSLEDLSVDEIEDTILLLKEEIGRLEEAKSSKQSHLSAAEALFSKS